VPVVALAVVAADDVVAVVSFAVLLLVVVVPDVAGCVVPAGEQAVSARATTAETRVFKTIPPSCDLRRECYYEGEAAAGPACEGSSDAGRRPRAGRRPPKNGMFRTCCAARRCRLPCGCRSIPIRGR